MSKRYSENNPEHALVRSVGIQLSLDHNARHFATRSRMRASVRVELLDRRELLLTHGALRVQNVACCALASHHTAILLHSRCQLFSGSEQGVIQFSLNFRVCFGCHHNRVASGICFEFYVIRSNRCLLSDDVS